MIVLDTGPAGLRARRQPVVFRSMDETVEYAIMVFSAGWSSAIPRGGGRSTRRRGRHASFALTSNRGVDEWLGLFDNPILGNSALDRLANAAHQLVIEGPSYCAKLAVLLLLVGLNALLLRG